MIDIPWYALFIAIIISAGVAYLVYSREFKLNALWKLAAAFRFFAVFFLVLLFFSPTIAYLTHKVVRPKIIVYRDNSVSCDSLSGVVKKEFLKKLENKFKGKLQIQEFQFAKDVNSVSIKIDPKDQQVTRFDHVIQHFYDNSKDESLVGAVLISDGILNQGQLPSNLKSASKIPLFTLGVGDSIEYPDLKVAGCLSNDQVFKENTFVVEGSFESIDNTNEDIRILLKEENRVIQSKVWHTKNAKDFIKYNFEVKPSKAGWIKYSLEIGGSKIEKNLKNNIREFWVQVVNEKKKIHIVYGKPHPDIKALKLALETKIQNEVLVYNASAGLKFGADVYVLHGFPNNKNDLSLVNNLMQKQLPVWVFLDNTVSGGVLSDVLGQNIGGAFSQWQEVTTQFNENYSGFSMEGNDQNWKVLGAVFTPLSKFVVANEFQTQLFQKWNGVTTNYPLFGTVLKNNHRTAWFFGNGIWKWRINESKKNKVTSFFDDWVSKNILWLSADSKKQKELEISLANRSIVLGSSENIKITHFNQAGLPENNSEINVYLLDSAGNKLIQTLSKTMNRYASVITPSYAGNFKLVAELKNNPNVSEIQLVSVTKSGLEGQNTTANFGFLYQLAKSNFGGFYHQNNLDKLVDKMSDSLLGAERIVDQEQSLTFIQIFWVLLLIVVLFSAEWFLRKWLGKI